MVPHPGGEPETDCPHGPVVATCCHLVQHTPGAGVPSSGAERNGSVFEAIGLAGEFWDPMADIFR